MKSNRELENLKSDLVLDSKLTSKLRNSTGINQITMNYSTPSGKKSKATPKSSAKSHSKSVSKSSSKSKRSRSRTPTRRSPSRSIKKPHKSLTTASVKLTPLKLEDVLKKELMESGKKRKDDQPHSSKKMKKLSTPSSTAKPVRTPKSESKKSRASKRVSFKGSDSDLSKSSRSTTLSSSTSSPSKSTLHVNSYWSYCNLM